ncbi:hypothetical protein IVB46_39575 [Bradyrhizobium sp. 61]|uniref:hypothetical protein n=1 Tax=unclassified Bradyrhizobium TaxID=2631580 RepID=UPI001FF9969A|nr:MULTISPECIES: hypothetical protein [unclassified Bradyrhizobium]MCK1281336.1 hypothetical protein [Bradyrhizobium sp. 61]MCK1446128.1 hypothetical protein [Bradyrhizobium sp. 48]MCK1461229.1 hypothetical protein [Bradyrhizobium sp. 2]
MTDHEYELARLKFIDAIPANIAVADALALLADVLVSIAAEAGMEKPAFMDCVETSWDLLGE